VLKKTNRPLFLKIPAEEVFIGLASGFVGQAATHKAGTRQGSAPQADDITLMMVRYCAG